MLARDAPVRSSRISAATLRSAERKFGRALGNPGDDVETERFGWKHSLGDASCYALGTK